MGGFRKAILLPLLGALTFALAAQPVAPPIAGKVEANGIEIAYESFGPTDREAILLISGYGASLEMWPEELCRELVRRGYG